MRRILVLVAALAASSCGGGSEASAPPTGTYRGDGENVLTLADPAWSLRTGRVLWSGTYRVAGTRLVLRTEAVAPPEGHASDCIDADESYRWAFENSQLRLYFRGEACNQNRRAVLTGFPWMGESPADEVD